MTFDDGPHPKLTPKLLDLLKERNIKATFFVIGKCVAEFPDIAKRIVDEGHEIANHSWNHPQLTKLSPTAFAAEITQTNEAIEKATGIRPVVMRPPYGAINPTLTKRLNEEYGLSVILWSVDPLDWKIRNSDHVSSHIIKNAAPGAIILAHDIHASTIDAMPAALDALQSKGYTFATVSELIAMDRPAAPKAQSPKSTP
jgi:peptidoglycan/xylan/chitin deacetylase (PgdA/CDA1 family)